MHLDNIDIFKFTPRLSYDYCTAASLRKLMRCPVTDIQLGATLELFPGSGGWSTALSKVGFTPEVEDWALDNTKDMSDVKYVNGRLIPMISSKKYAAVHIATECTTHSTMTGKLYRTMEEPDGTQVALADAKIGPIVLNANKQVEHSVKAFIASDDSGALTSLENPKGSRLFATTAMKPLMARVLAGELYLIETSYCMWGRKFRGTRWIISNYPELQALAKQCKHSCHEGILAGHSIPTKQANPYPPRMCAAWAAIIQSVVLARKGSSSAVGCRFRV